jgi:hypothetical protein
LIAGDLLDPEADVKGWQRRADAVAQIGIGVDLARARLSDLRGDPAARTPGRRACLFGCRGGAIASGRQ